MSSWLQRCAVCAFGYKSLETKSFHHTSSVLTKQSRCTEHRHALLSWYSCAQHECLGYSQIKVSCASDSHWVPRQREIRVRDRKTQVIIPRHPEPFTPRVA